MKKFRVRLTRDCRLTQSAFVEVEAENPDHAETVAMEIPQEDVAWEDDDFFEAGEGGTYVADPSEILELSECDECGAHVAEIFGCPGGAKV